MSFQAKSSKLYCEASFRARASFSARVDKVNGVGGGGGRRRVNRLCTRDPHSAWNSADFANDEANRKKDPLPEERLGLVLKLHRTSSIFRYCGRSTWSFVRFRFIGQSLERISRTQRGQDVKNVLRTRGDVIFPRKGSPFRLTLPDNEHLQ